MTRRPLEERKATMPKELKLPELGENIETAVVSGLLVSPGDTVQKETRRRPKCPRPSAAW
jgi:hypothetical protein